ncbi:MAG: peptidase M4, partial [Bacteroidetes bacterium]|nr:peptidase M4 [Bacteroidota bacterium]
GYSEKNALGLALDHVSAKTYMWTLPAEENLLKYETGNPFASYYPKGSLVIINPEFSDAVFKLAYKFDIYAADPLYRAYVYVDANTGSILFERNRIHTADSTGTAVTAYSGNQTIIADYTGSNFRLRETGRGNGIQTFDMNEGTSYGSAVDFTDGNNFWNNVNAQQDEVATDAHWGAEMTYDYYFNTFGRNSYDDAGAKIFSYVHFFANYNNG